GGECARVADRQGEGVAEDRLAGGAGDGMHGGGVAAGARAGSRVVRGGRDGNISQWDVQGAASGAAGRGGAGAEAGGTDRRPAPTARRRVRGLKRRRPQRSWPS